MLNSGTAAPPPAPRQTASEIERRDEMISNLETAVTRFKIDRAAEQKKVDAAIAAYEKWEKPKRDREEAGLAAQTFVGQGLAAQSELRRLIEAAAPPVLRQAIAELRRSMELRNPPQYGFAETALNQLDALRFVAGDLAPTIKAILRELHEQDMSVLVSPIEPELGRQRPVEVAS